MRFLFLLFIIVFYSSCNNIIEKDIDTVFKNETKLGTESRVKLNTNKPIIIDSTDYIIFPVSGVNNFKRKSFSIESSNDYSQYLTEYNNIVFYNKVTGNYTFLSDSLINIQNFNIFRNFYEKLHKDFIFYNIYDTDFNKDGKINSQDPISLYVSEISGQGFLKVLPANLSLIDITSDKEETKIYIRAYSDSNNDFIFDSNDKISVLCYDLKQPKVKASNVFDKKFITKLESLLIKK